MLRASATVMHLGRTDIVKSGSNPIRRPMRAVEYKENTVERMTEANISAACLLTSCKKQRLFYLHIMSWCLLLKGVDFVRLIISILFISYLGISLAKNLNHL